MQGAPNPDAGAFRPPSQPVHRRPSTQTEFERALIEQIESIGETVNMLASTVESIELKLDEYIQIRGRKPCPASTQSNPSDSNRSALLSERAPSDPVLSGYVQERSTNFPSSTTEYGQQHIPQSDKLLMCALNKILASMPSQYDGVADVYEEIRLFVAVTMNLIPDITPHAIISQALMPYLRSTEGGKSAPLLHLIWNDMLNVTGCNQEEIRRTFKRMIDTHCRGFRRKILSLDNFPAPVSLLTKWLKTNVLNQHDDED